MIQAWDFAPGDNFVAKMQAASVEAARTLAVLSPDYLRSRFGTEEWTAALADGTLLPVRVREVELGGMLAVQVYVDLVGLSEAAAREQLLAALGRKGRRKPSGKPGFPGSQPRFPAALPDIWNVPATRNANFTGRDSELDRLVGALSARHVVALTGLGGMGKSQLSIQLAHRCAPQLEIVWWVAAEETTTIIRDLAKLAERLGIEAEEEPMAAEAARRRLEQRGGWLLVFDNARDTTAVRPFVPQAQTGWTLITSRHSAWGGVAGAETLGPLAPGPAAELLARRAGLRDPRSADELVARLDGLPLALEQAGAYLEATGMPVAEYVALFDARWGELLARGREPGRPTMVTVWELSFQELEEQAALGARLLTIAAFLAPDDIPRSVFGGAEALPEELAPLRDPLAYGDAVAALTRYSLIDQAVDGFSVHRLVQHATRERMAESDRRQMSEWTVALLQSALPYDVMVPATWSPTARLVPHALRACEHARHFGADRVAVADLLRTIGSYLWRKADYREALALLELAVADAESADALGRDVLFECLGVLGTVLAELGDIDGAERQYERAIQIGESAYGPAAAQLAFPLKNLGSVFSDRGDLDAAQNAYERALAIDEAASGPDAAVVATGLNGLASVLTRRGDLDGAQAAFERALRIDVDVYGPDHPNVGVRLSNLASLQHRRGDPRAAVDLYRRALAIDEAAYGPDHPEVATDLGNLGGPLVDLGEVEQARDLHERALAIREQVYGRDHPRVAMSLNELSSVHRERGDLDAARAALERALAIDEQAHGRDHPSIAIRLNNLGMVAQEGGDLDAARAAYERALSIALAVWGPEHDGVAVLRGNLASL